MYSRDNLIEGKDFPGTTKDFSNQPQLPDSFSFELFAFIGPGVGSMRHFMSALCQQFVNLEVTPVNFPPPVQIKGKATAAVTGGREAGKCRTAVEVNLI